jgi:DNA repair protein RadC
LLRNQITWTRFAAHSDQLKAALGLLDIRVLDHLIVAGTDAFSFAEKGLM